MSCPDSKLWDNQVAENCRVKALWKMIVLKAAATMAAALVAASVAAPGPAQVRQKLCFDLLSSSFRLERE